VFVVAVSGEERRVVERREDGGRCKRNNLVLRVYGNIVLFN